MRELEFRKYMDLNRGFTENSVNTRINQGRKAESLLNMDFEQIVKEDKLMFNSLNKLQEYDNPKNAPMQNALRVYYTFVNKKVFPKLKNF